ncbi:EAL domain-containing protein [Oleomonas cavernae]|uniref:EAL domain-containing protein n=1 Tax=Oleomonas cavernae TaxID=2320859 RepID=A0A418WIX0_9PROT|nr:EAL domain-containing protein [Oleomonas cavernae]
MAAASANSHVRQGAIVAWLYFILAVACIALSRLQVGEIANLWLGNAVVIGLVWRNPAWHGRYLLGGIFLAATAANLVTGADIVLALGLSAANLIEIALAITLLNWLSPIGQRIATPASYFILISIALAAAAVGATCGSLFLALRGQAGFTLSWWPWWSGSSTGALMALPLAVAASKAAWQEMLEGSRKWEALAFALLSVPLVNYALAHLHYPLAVVALPLVFMALRLNALAIALLALIKISTVIATGLTGNIISVAGQAGFLGTSLQLSAGLAILPAFCVALVIGRQRVDQHALRKSEARFRNAMDNSAIGMALVGLDGSWNRVNRSLCEMLGYSPDELLHTTFQAITHPDDLASDLNEVGRVIAGEIDSYRMEKRYIRKDGSIIWALLAVSIMRDPRSRVPLYFISQIEDIDKRKQAEDEQRSLTEALYEEKERLRTTLYSIGDAVMCTDAEQRVTFMNPIAEQLTGWLMAEASGRPLTDVFRLVEQGTDKPAPSPVEACLRSLAPYYINGDLVLIARNGERRSIQDSAAPIRKASGDIIGSVLVFQDVTKAKTLQRELEHSALHDALTGLPNRKALEQGLTAACQQASQQNRAHSLCFIDLDRFKVINDSAGHAAGDVLLREVARTIRANVRTGDLTARLGGDEFAVILADCAIEQAEGIGNKLVEAIGAMSFVWDEKIYTPGASIGICEISPTATLGDLMSQADVACYAAKSAGRNRVSLYRPGESDAKRHHQDIHVAAGIRAAITANRFRLFAQEILDLRQDGRRRPYYEILLRLENEAGEMIAPGGFIPAAERYDLMGDVDRWVVRTLLRDYGPRLRGAHDLALAINLSANSLNDPSLWPFMQTELHASGLAPGRLHFEITETALINNLQAASQFVSAARAADCSITLDDFGSGLSSFPYLRQFPVDQIKIDGNFIRQLKTSMADRTIVEAINDLGHRFGATTVAEFIEDAETLAIVREMGVDKAQGYFIGRPVPLDSIL